MTTVYETTFLINWPRHLGGGHGYITLRGAMHLVPMIGVDDR